MASHKCANNGCGIAFTESENNDTACIYHSGSAIFHEGLKGWSCCKKRVISFEEFMQIPGCSNGAHVPEAKKPQPAPSEPPKSIAPSSSAPPSTAPSPSFAPPSSTSSSSTNTPPPTRTPTAPAKPPAVVEEENDPFSAVIPPGSKCRRLGCDVVYREEKQRKENCTYHPGVPVFHEGSKGYSCCRMVGDFDDFLKMPGCKTGRHRFLESQAEAAAAQQVTLRHDWYQMGPNVVVCVYAKGIDKTKSVITFEAQKLSVELVLPEGKTFRKEFNLSQETDPSKSKYEILSTKVEIKLYKTSATQWSSLE